MARPKKTDAPDLAHPIDLTAGAIERLTCPPGKQQAFLRDSKAPGLRVRVTTAGAKSFVFEAKLNRQTIRRTIGDVRAWTIEQARAEANRMRVTLDAGQDPRELERQREAAQLADQQAQQSAAAAAALTVGEAWATYIEARRPRWGERHLADHQALSAAGRERQRGQGLTKPGPLHAFMGEPLRELTAARVDAWAAAQADMRPTQARLALRLLRAFVNWCASHGQYGRIVPAGNAATSAKAREALGIAKPKNDALMREQLPAWFGAVRGLGNSVAAAYLQAVLLTGARPGEVLTMRWEDLNLQWRGLTLRDKVEGERVIPLTPYVAQLLAGLPRRGPFVFQSAQAGGGEPRPIRKPNHINARVCQAAAIEGLTLHGLRRSFGSLSEWLEMPAGVVAQIQGHKPSATAEKHYRVRPLDLLRVHHDRFEAWILEQAGVPFTPKAASGKLVAVK